jgi:hypothetical protein
MKQSGEITTYVESLLQRHFWFASTFNGLLRCHFGLRPHSTAYFPAAQLAMTAAILLQGLGLTFRYW